MTKTEAKHYTPRHAKTVPWWDKELNHIQSLRNKCLHLYRAYRTDERLEEYCTHKKLLKDICTKSANVYKTIPSLGKKIRMKTLSLSVRLFQRNGFRNLSQK